MSVYMFTLISERKLLVFIYPTTEQDICQVGATPPNESTTPPTPTTLAEALINCPLLIVLDFQFLMHNNATRHCFLKYRNRDSQLDFFYYYYN